MGRGGFGLGFEGGFLVGRQRSGLVGGCDEQACWFRLVQMGCKLMSLITGCVVFYTCPGCLVHF